MPPEVVEAMLPYFNKRGYGHPSITNKPGWEAYEVVWEARKLLVKTINAHSPEGVVFTHGGTEANNLASEGGARIQLCAPRWGAEDVGTDPKGGWLAYVFLASSLLGVTYVDSCRACLILLASLIMS